jgi:hypothetical protein
VDREPPKIAFLDQNKWIDLAHAFDNPKSDLWTFEIGEQLIQEVSSGRLLIPLTGNLLVETYKMGDAGHRALIAEVQAQLCQGYVIRDRRTRLAHEVSFAVRGFEKLPPMQVPLFWWLSRNFFEAFCEWSVAVSEFGAQPDQLAGIKADPKFALFHWLSTAPEEERSAAMANDAKLTRELIDQIESRVARLENTPFASRRRVYSATLCLDEQVRIGTIARSNGIPWLSDNDDRKRRLAQLKRLISDVPTYRAEVELAVRVESLGRPITRNDLGDMEAYVAASPYCNVVIGEKTFVNLLRQAKLPDRFGCKVSTSIGDLIALLR